MPSLEELASHSINAFIDAYQITNEKGQRISFEDRRFLVEPLNDWSRFQVYKKAAQVGMTVTFLIKEAWAVKNKRWNIGHTFPADTDANSFVSTKANPMFSNNKAFMNIQADNIERKQIGDNFLFFMGTNSESKALEKSLDVLIHDEIDRSNTRIIQMFRSRLQASHVKAIWKLSNPSIEGAGVDIDWNKSDKKEWFVTCENGHAHPMTWPDSVEIEKKRFICKECKTELSDDDRRWGEWVKTGDIESDISGYHMSLLMCPWVDVGDVLREWDEGKDPEHFYNFVLGEPYSPGDTKISRTMILDNWTPKNIVTGNYYIGVDVGNTKNFVIGSEKGITRVGTFTDWNFFDDLMARYKPKVVVIDALPDNTMALYYKDKYDVVFINYFGKDKESNRLVRYGEKDKEGIITSDRSRVIDTIVMELLEGKILYGLASDRDFQEYIKQCEVMRRIKVTNNQGIERYTWEALEEKADHYWFATIYWWLARESAGNGVVISPFIGERPDPIMSTSEGTIVGDIGESLGNYQYGEEEDY